jgi:hypothetical protein
VSPPRRHGEKKGEARRMFRDLDQDKSCGLNAKEVQQGLAKLHIDVPEDELGTHFTVG